MTVQFRVSGCTLALWFTLRPQRLVVLKRGFWIKAFLFHSIPFYKHQVYTWIQNNKKTNLGAWCEVKQNVVHLSYSVICCVTKICGMLHANSTQSPTMKSKAWWKVEFFLCEHMFLRGDGRLISERGSYYMKCIPSPTKSLSSSTKCLKNSSCSQIFLWCHFLYLT